jgi:ABC-type cobalamin transport system permease subunit
VLDSVGGIIDNVVTTKEEKEQLKLEIAKEVNRNLEAMSQQSLAETSAYLQDAQSARSREVELAKAGAKDKTPSTLAYIAVFGLIGILLFLLIFGFGSLTTDQALIVGTLLGAIAGNANQAYNYYLGSSLGSKTKEIQLNKGRE